MEDNKMKIEVQIDKTSEESPENPENRKSNEKRKRGWLSDRPKPILRVMDAIDEAIDDLGIP